MSQTFEAKLTTSGALIGKDVSPEHETLSFERGLITLVDLLEKRDEEKTALIRAHLHFNSARKQTSVANYFQWKVAKVCSKSR